MTSYHRILADEWRRIAVEVLDGESEISLVELAGEIASRNGESTDPHAVAVSLHHNHAPLLQQVGAIDYDRDRRRITTRRPVIGDVAELARRMTRDTNGMREVTP